MMALAASVLTFSVLYYGRGQHCTIYFMGEAYTLSEAMSKPNKSLSIQPFSVSDRSTKPVKGDPVVELYVSYISSSMTPIGCRDSGSLIERLSFSYACQLLPLSTCPDSFVFAGCGTTYCKPSSTSCFEIERLLA